MAYRYFSRIDPDTLDVAPALHYPHLNVAMQWAVTHPDAPQFVMTSGKQLTDLYSSADDIYSVGKLAM